jgi:mannosyltransferase OCH1-like enzyme
MAQLGMCETVIPKNLISCWFGRGAKKKLFRDCIATWHEILHDWKFYEINEDTIGHFGGCRYINSVLERGEVVKATELGRLIGLARWGGFYFDADIELLKPPDPLLGHDFVIGREDAHTINGAVIGSAAGGTIVRRLIEKFPQGSDGTEKATAYGPVFLTNALREPSLTPTILPPEYFYPRHFSGTGAITPNSYTNHH